MKLHRFYLNDKNPSRRLHPYLYAYTDDNKLAKAFKETRNSDILTYISGEITQAEFLNIKRTNSQSNITETRFKTKSPSSPTVMITIPVVCTWEEESTVNRFCQDILTTTDMCKYMRDTGMLSVEVNSALRLLGYFDIYNFLSITIGLDTPRDPFLSGMFPVENDADFFRTIEYDEFEVFMHLYGETLKKAKDL